MFTTCSVTRQDLCGSCRVRFCLPCDNVTSCSVACLETPVGRSNPWNANEHNPPVSIARPDLSLYEETRSQTAQFELYAADTIGELEAVGSKSRRFRSGPGGRQSAYFDTRMSALVASVKSPALIISAYRASSQEALADHHSRSIPGRLISTHPCFRRSKPERCGAGKSGSANAPTGTA